MLTSPGHIPWEMKSLLGRLNFIKAHSRYSWAWVQIIPVVILYQYGSLDDVHQHMFKVGPLENSLLHKNSWLMK